MKMGKVTWWGEDVRSHDPVIYESMVRIDKTKVIYTKKVTTCTKLLSLVGGLFTSIYSFLMLVHAFPSRQLFMNSVLSHLFMIKKHSSYSYRHEENHLTIPKHSSSSTAFDMIKTDEKIKFCNPAEKKHYMKMK